METFRKQKQKLEFCPHTQTKQDDGGLRGCHLSVITIYLPRGFYCATSFENCFLRSCFLSKHTIWFSIPYIMSLNIYLVCHFSFWSSSDKYRWTDKNADLKVWRGIQRMLNENKKTWILTQILTDSRWVNNTTEVSQIYFV